MHNLKSNFDKMLDIYKQLFTNELGSISRSGVVPRFSDLELVAWSLIAEALGIDSENLLFIKLTTGYKEYLLH
jgi:hypothetical protein